MLLLQAVPVNVLKKTRMPFEPSVNSAGSTNDELFSTPITTNLRLLAGRAHDSIAVFAVNVFELVPVVVSVDGKVIVTTAPTRQYLIVDAADVDPLPLNVNVLEVVAHCSLDTSPLAVLVAY